MLEEAVEVIVSCGAGARHASRHALHRRPRAPLHPPPTSRRRSRVAAAGRRRRSSPAGSVTRWSRPLPTRSSCAFDAGGGGGSRRYGQLDVCFAEAAKRRVETAYECWRERRASAATSARSCRSRAYFRRRRRPSRASRSRKRWCAAPTSGAILSRSPSSSAPASTVSTSTRSALTRPRSYACARASCCRLPRRQHEGRVVAITGASAGAGRAAAAAFARRGDSVGLMARGPGPARGDASRRSSVRACGLRGPGRRGRRRGGRRGGRRRSSGSSGRSTSG